MDWIRADFRQWMRAYFAVWMVKIHDPGARYRDERWFWENIADYFTAE